VTGAWSGASSTTTSATTNTSGIAYLTSKQVRSNSTLQFTFTVTSVNKAGSTYNAAGNTETTDTLIVQ
jgi:hypothetical protein